MLKSNLIRWTILLLIAFFANSGCIYFNTFFNAKKKFREAEDIQLKNKTGQQNRGGGQRGARGGNRSGGRRGNSNIGGQGTSKVTPQVRLLYEDAIKKASKVLKFHPESKYVDDALWLIGKSYFNIGDYILSDRKFQELAINHPESKYTDDSYYYSGLCQIELGNDELAMKAFSKIEANFNKSDYFDDVYFAKGKMDKKSKNYAQAIDQFSLYLEKFPKGDSAAKAVFCIAQCKDELGEFYDAYLTYASVEKAKPSKELYFDATLASAVAVLKTDSIHIGMEILVALSKNESYFANSSKIRLRIAEGYFLQGNIDKAIEEYTEVTVQAPRTEEAAEAYYRLGLIYQNDIYDIEKAKESFSKAQNENRESEYRNLALSKSAQIAKLESYLIQLQKADSIKSAQLGISPDTTAIDTTFSVEDTMLIYTVQDSLPGDAPSIDSIDVVFGPFPEIIDDSLAAFIGPLEDSTLVILDTTQNIDKSGPGDDIKVEINQDSLNAVTAARDDSIRQEIIRSGIKTRFLLAELYAYELNRPDSALTEYLLLVNEYPNSPYAVRALLAMANIELNRADTLNASLYLGRLIEEYPESPQAVRAAEFLEFPLDLSQNAIGLYARAESLIYYDDNPDSAIILFQHIADNFPDLAPKASFAIAWTLDNIIGVTDSSAFYAYASINKTYPQTEYGSAAKIRLGLDSKPRFERKANRDREKESEEGRDDPLADPDSALALAMGLPNAPRVIELGEFLYPEELLNKDLKGQVIFKIKLDITGKVQDYEIIGPSGERAIDSVATFALLETEFDVSNYDFTQLDSFFRYSIRFERPEIDLFNDPYRDRRESEGH